MKGDGLVDVGVGGFPFAHSRPPSQVGSEGQQIRSGEDLDPTSDTWHLKIYQHFMYGQKEKRDL